jgi:hypothetical protein
MRFLMLMIPNVYQGKNVDTFEGPSAEAVSRMMAYNEELANAGALIALDGLRPMSFGGRVSFVDGKPTTIDGPFVEAKEVIGGYWIINAASKEEAMRWAERVPADQGDVIEVRQIFEMEDFPDDVQQAAESDVVKAAIAQ